MNVVKRNGNKEEVSFDKILNRVKKLCNDVEPVLKINYSFLVIKVIEQLYDNIQTKMIDELTAEQCASLSTKHPDYGLLASRIIISNNHKNTKKSFSTNMISLYNFKDINNKQSPLISDNLYNIVLENEYIINNIIDYSRDYIFDYFGFKTLERAYLMRINNIIIERPQHMWMRVSLGIHGEDIESAIETYNLMSLKFFTHATPTLFHAGTPRPQLSSCYLIGMENDSIDGIYNTLKETASISKWAGGIGMHIHNIRANGSHIRGTNGKSNGIVPMLRVFNMTARYVDQGGGKRNGSFSIYLEPWHADIEDFLDLRKNHGDEEMRARDLFYGLWIPDLFMNKVKNNEEWNLFCPDKCPGLSDCYGSEFTDLYNKYSSENKEIKKVKARELWLKILDSQMETGTPYLLYKDAANMKSNQKNIGTIKSSNLCTEIIEYSDDEQTAVCNLASIGLSKFVKNDKTFDYDKLECVTKIITKNLNKIIDINFYPTNKTKLSNFLHRPIGIGVQGLADVFALMNIPFHSEEAKLINKNIFETIYYASITQSMLISKTRSYKLINLYNYLMNDTNNKEKLIIINDGRLYNENISLSDKNMNKDYHMYKPIRDELFGNKKLLDKANLNIRNINHIGSYSSFDGSPLYYGKFQFDLWDKNPSDKYDWNTLRINIMKYGIRNSLLVAPMPTASTSQILGNNECFEPFTSNLYSRRTIAGEFILVNKYLMKELIDMNIWNDDLKNKIILNNGSIQNIDNIPDNIKLKYKIVWEIPMKHLIDMSVDRAAYICQSQSLNLWMADPNYKSLTSMHFYAWKSGLKTGLYYLRRKPKHNAQQFTIEPTLNKKNENENENENDDECMMCSG